MNLKHLPLRWSKIKRKKLCRKGRKNEQRTGKSQKEDRKKNPVVEYNKIQNKYYPELFAKFAEVNDPRNQSYIEYPVMVMLGTMYYKCISGISSMQEMTLKFNDDAVVENLYSFMSEEKKEYLPHGVIENEFLARLNPEELEKNTERYCLFYDP